MGKSNYKLTDEQKGKLNDIVHDIIEQIEIKSEEHSCLDVYYTTECKRADDGRFDNNKFAAMVWYIGDRLSSY